MKTISVVSGKGGTGKTSIVASFAALAKPVVLADCDVDAADLHLVVTPTTSKRNSFSGAKVAQINPELCTDCGLCQELCRFDAIQPLRHGSPSGSPSLSIDPIACEGCGVCEWFCPEKAISLVEERSGEWYISETKYGPMVHARLGIAAENSGRLVTVVRNFASGIARAKGIPYMIIDGPPGIGCPVIASVTGVDYALIVTEPTMSGQHDLGRIASLTAHFKIPTRVCINKWDLNPAMTEKIENWGENTGNPVIAKIRFDHTVTTAQVKHIPVVDFSSNGITEDIRKLWEKVKEEVDTPLFAKEER
ncbi:MAG: ATP-binding protein [bacterium]